MQQRTDLSGYRAFSSAVPQPFVNYDSFYEETDFLASSCLVSHLALDITVSVPLFRNLPRTNRVSPTPIATTTSSKDADDRAINLHLVWIYVFASYQIGKICWQLDRSLKHLVR